MSFPQQKKKWFKAEEKRLLDFHKQGWSVARIANYLGRTTASVSSKLYDLQTNKYERSGNQWSDTEINVLEHNLDLPNNRLALMLRREPKEINAKKFEIRRRIAAKITQKCNAVAEHTDAKKSVMKEVPILDLAKIEDYCSKHPNVASLVVSAAAQYLYNNVTERQTALLKTIGALR